MNKLAIIISDSEPFLKNSLVDIYKSWGYNSNDLIETSEWKTGLSSVTTLFGTPFVHLNLTNKNHLNSFKKIFTDKSTKKEFEDVWFGNGVIITTSDLKSSSKLIKNVELHNGIVIKPTDTSKIDDEIKSLPINNELKSFIFDFARDNVDKKIQILNTIENLSTDVINNLTIEDLYSYFPKTPGSIPPWEVSNFLFKGNTTETLKNLDLYFKTEHPLILVSIIKNKLRLFYKYKFYENMGYKGLDNIATQIGLKGNQKYQLLDFVNGKQVSIDNVIYLNELLLTLENALKGGVSRLPGQAKPLGYLNEDYEYVKYIILKMLFTINYNRKL